MKNIQSAIRDQFSPMIGNTLLLMVVFTIVFIVPLFPLQAHRSLYNLLYTVMFFTAVTALERKRNTMLLLAGLVLVAEWFSYGMNLPILTAIARVTMILYFGSLVIGLIGQIAGTRKVTTRIILEAINGYLLLGVIFALLVTFVMLYQPEAFSFPEREAAFAQPGSHSGDYIYYAFVTYTTVGYGDVVPKLPYAKSLAILMSVTGQIYVAVIIAMLVGKYSSGGD